MKRTLSFVFVAAFTILFTTGAYAEWVLYDNLNKYANIEEMKASPKWYISAEDEAIAKFSIVDGRLRIEHLAGNPDDSAWAQLIKKPHRILGIRATVTVESSTGDLRGRIGAWIGKVGDYYVFDQLSLQSGLNRIWGAAHVLETGAGPWLYDLFWGRFMEPIDLIGNTFTITMIFSKKKKITYGVSGLGQITVRLPEAMSPTDRYFKGIGTRSEDGSGSGVVYFDDVYVLKYFR